MSKMQPVEPIDFRGIADLAAENIQAERDAEALAAEQLAAKQNAFAEPIIAQIRTKFEDLAEKAVHTGDQTIKTSIHNEEILTASLADFGMVKPQNHEQRCHLGKKHIAQIETLRERLVFEELDLFIPSCTSARTFLGETSAASGVSKATVEHTLTFKATLNNTGSIASDGAYPEDIDVSVRLSITSQDSIDEAFETISKMANQKVHKSTPSTYLDNISLTIDTSLEIRLEDYRSALEGVPKEAQETELVVTEEPKPSRWAILQNLSRLFLNKATPPHQPALPAAEPKTIAPDLACLELDALTEMRREALREAYFGDILDALQEKANRKIYNALNASESLEMPDKPLMVSLHVNDRLGLHHDAESAFAKEIIELVEEAGFQNAVVSFPNNMRIVAQIPNLRLNPDQEAGVRSDFSDTAVALNTAADLRALSNIERLEYLVEIAEQQLGALGIETDIPALQENVTVLRDKLQDPEDALLAFFEGPKYRQAVRAFSIFVEVTLPYLSELDEIREKDKAEVQRALEKIQRSVRGGIDEINTIRRNLYEASLFSVNAQLDMAEGEEPFPSGE